MTKNIHTATHTGICQACGRRQAVHVYGGKIAKHGYTTDYGYFNGVCGGSDELPLELDTSCNVKIVAGLLAFAAEQDAKAIGEITHVTVKISAKWVGRKRVTETKSVDRAEFEATQPSYLKFDDAVQRLRQQLARTAEMVRADAKTLETLRGEVFGQPLVERPFEAPIKREYVNNYRDACKRIAELKAQGVTARQRRERWSNVFTITYR